MFYSLQLKDSAKADTKVYKGVEVNKEYPVYVETEQDLATAEKAAIVVTPLTSKPERDHKGDYPVINTI